MKTTVGGIILAGGRSSRMGRNKALLRLEPTAPTLIEQVKTALLAANVSSPLIVTNTAAEYEWLGLGLVADNFPGAGPLAGIEAGLQASQFEYNLVVACDMPYLKPALLQQLIAQISPTTQAIIPYNIENKPEPLCAIYAKGALPAIRTLLKQGHFKLMGLADEIELTYLPASLLQAYDQSLDSFKNLNTPADLSLS